MTWQTGRRNLITDVPGIRVGNAENKDLLSGTTIIIPDRPATAAVDIRGGGPGSRETALLAPEGTVSQIDAITLSGGSAFGLDAATGAMQWLRENGRGYQVGEVRVPIVPAAILFDLLNGGNKDWQGTSPYVDLGYRACANAVEEFNLGNAGAGLGAQAGPLKGGLGSCSVVDPETGSVVLTPSPVASFIYTMASICSILVSIKRLHDLNMTGFFALGLIVPPVAIIMSLWLGIRKGDDGPNKFGWQRDVRPTQPPPTMQDDEDRE